MIDNKFIQKAMGNKQATLCLRNKSLRSYLITIGAPHSLTVSGRKLIYLNLKFYGWVQMFWSQSLFFLGKKIQPVWVKTLHRMWYCNSPVCHFFKFTHEKFSHSTKATTLNLLLPCFFFLQYWVIHKTRFNLGVCQFWNMWLLGLVQRTWMFMNPICCHVPLRIRFTGLLKSPKWFFC